MDGPLRPEPVAAGVVRLSLVSQAALLGEPTNTYIAATIMGGVVVDPASRSPEAIEAIENIMREVGGLAGIVVTHGHADHWEGVVPLWERHGGWVAAHPRLVGRIPDIPKSAYRLLREGDILGGWTVLETPGHTWDHIVLWRKSDGVMLVGDVAAGVGTTIISPPEGDMAVYLETLRRLKQLHPRVLLPGHGPPLSNAVAALEALIQHRLAREQAVLAALDETPRSVRELVPRVYADVPPERWPLAEHSLLAHLIKLEAEGRAARHLGGWTVRRPSKSG